MRKLLIIFIILLIHKGFLFSQENNEPDPKNILDYKLISQTVNEIKQIQSANLTEDKKTQSYQDKRLILLKELKKYHSKFIKNKKIWEKMDLNGYKDKFKNPNEIRLFIKKYFKTAQNRRFIKNIPILFDLHSAVGLCYEKEKRPYNALSHYFAAFRYRSFGATKNDFIDKDRLYFLPDNSPEKNDALEFSKLLKDKNKLEKQIENTKKKVSVEISRKAMGLSHKLTQVNSQLKQLEQDYKSIQEKYNQAYKNLYLKYRQKKVNIDAKLLFAMANVVKELENRNKKRLRILARANYGNAISNDYTQNRNFVGYAALLELAHRLDLENNLYNEKLSDEFTRSQKMDKAIAYTKLFIKTEKEKKNTEQNTEKIKKFYFRLGGLYTNIRKYLLATEEFEKFIDLANPQKDEKQIHKAHYYLGQLHSSKTGNLDKAYKNFIIWLNEEKKLQSALNLKDKLTSISRQFSALKSIAHIMKKKRLSKQEFHYLILALKKYESISQMENSLKKSMLAAEKKMLELKKLLRSKSVQTDSMNYRDAKNSLEQKKNDWKNAIGYKKIMNIVKIKLRLAAILYEGRDYQKAISLYSSLIKSSQAVDFSRKKIKMIRAILNSAKK